MTVVETAAARGVWPVLISRAPVLDRATALA